MVPARYRRKKWCSSPKNSRYRGLLSAMMVSLGITVVCFHLVLVPDAMGVSSSSSSSSSTGTNERPKPSSSSRSSSTSFLSDHAVCRANGDRDSYFCQGPEYEEFADRLELLV